MSRRKKELHEYSEEELRDMLMRKRTAGRDARIAAYRASGRIVSEQELNAEEEFQKGRNEKANMPDPVPPKRKLDTFLLIVEILAVAGIVAILIMSTQILGSLNRQAQEAFVLPTLTPTPLVRAVVLPGGHTPPDESGEASFNESEIPSHLRDMVLVSQPTPVPQLDADRVVRVRIPAIDVDAPVVQGDDWEALKSGVGMNLSSADPGEAGNIILSGHNDIFGQVFRDLDELKPNDEIILLTEKRSYTYKVTGTQIVSPARVEVLSQTDDETVTLISCYPYMVDTQRIVVTGKLRD